jgi:hypothetical protein
MLPDLIRDALAEAADSGRRLTNEELALLVIEKIGDDHLREALQQCLPAMIPQVRNQENKKFLRPLKEHEHEHEQESRVLTGGAAGSMTPDGPRHNTPLGSFLLADRLLQFTITGMDNRAIRLGEATLADLRHEIDISSSRGETLLRRASLFEEMQSELASSNLKTVGELPFHTRDKYARRLGEIYS